eukprot:g3628.t1
MAVLNTMVEALLPPLSPEETERMVKMEKEKYELSGMKMKAEHEKKLRSWCKVSGLDLDIPVKVANQIHAHMPADTISELGLFLTILSTSPGTALISGFSYFSPFSDLSIKERQSVLLGLKDSSLSLFRKAFRGFKTLIFLKFLTTTKGLAKFDGKNPNWELMGYHITPN